MGLRSQLSVTDHLATKGEKSQRCLEAKRTPVPPVMYVIRPPDSRSGGIVVSPPASPHNHPGSIPGSGLCSVEMGVLLLLQYHVFRKGH